MLNNAFTIRSVNGLSPRDGSPLMVKCDKRDGLILCKVNGLSKIHIRKIDPSRAEIRKVGEGEFNAWTGRFPGTWELDVWDHGGVASFRMKNKGDAVALKKWIEKRASKGGE